MLKCHKKNTTATQKYAETFLASTVTKTTRPWNSKLCLGLGKKKRKKKPCLEMLMVGFKYLYVSALNQWLQLLDVCSRDCEMVPPLEWPTRSQQRLRLPLAFYPHPFCPLSSMNSMFNTHFSHLLTSMRVTPPQSTSPLMSPPYFHIRRKKVWASWHVLDSDPSKEGTTHSFTHLKLWVSGSAYIFSVELNVWNFTFKVACGIGGWKYANIMI